MGVDEIIFFDLPEDHGLSDGEFAIYEQPSEQDIMAGQIEEGA